MRRTLLLSMTILALFSGATLARAQASAPSHGMGPMHGWHMNRDNTPGWSMMTRAERREHHDRMAAMTDHAQCAAYMQQHHATMAERAKTRGHAMPAMPRHDACAPLKK
jgi:hypothetical protein